MSTFPVQQLSRSKKDPKTRHGEKFHADSADYLIGCCTFSSGMSKLYRVYNGELFDEDYSYVTNAYGLKGLDGRPLMYPARIRNYNILLPIINSMLGEKNKRYVNYQIVVQNPDVVPRRQEAAKQALGSVLAERFLQGVQAAGVPVNADQPPTATPPGLDRLQADFEESYKDMRALLGEHGMNALVDNLELRDLHQTAYFDYLVGGRCASYKGIRHNDVVYEVLYPEDLDYDRASAAPFIEDRAWAVRRMEMSASEAVDRFYDIMPKELVDYLLGDSTQPPITGGRTELTEVDLPNLLHPQDRTGAGANVIVYHVEWKSQCRIGELTYPDGTGILQKMYVDETYVPAPGESVKWMWVNEKRQCYRLNDNQYFGFGLAEGERRALENQSICKLSFNGRAFSDRGAENTSYAGLGYQLQILYNIYQYRFELTMAKNKDKVALIDKSIIPTADGWNEDRFMYNIEAAGIGFIDQLQVGPRNMQALNQVQVMDMSLGRYAEATLRVLEAIKDQLRELMGFTPSRLGQTAASDGLGKTQQEIFQSAVITDELVRRFDKWVEREMQGLLDLGKLAWKDGKKGSYITPEYTQQVYDIEPGDIQEAELGIRVVNSGEEDERLRALKAQATQFAQNGVDPTVIADILSANSFTKIRKLMKEASAATQQMMQQQQQAAAQQEQQALQQTLAAQQAERDWQSEEKALDRIAEYQLEMLRLQYTSTADSSQLDAVKASLEQEKLRLQQLQQQRDQEQKRLDADLKERDSRRKDATARHQIETNRLLNLKELETMVRENAKDRASKERISRQKKPSVSR